MLTRTIDRGPISPTAEELPELAALSHFLEEHPAGDLRIIDQSGDKVPLPETMLRVIERAAQALAQDRVVTIRQMSKDLTLDQVEKLAGIPRSEIVRLLDQNVVPSYVLDGLRRVRFEDAMTLRQRQDAIREDALQFLANQGQEIAPRLH